MKNEIGPVLVLAVLVFSWASVAPTGQTKQPIALPQSGVPQVYTMEGKFVRAAYNNEGYVILGYQATNRSVGEEWMLLDVGITLREKMPSFKLTRDALSIETPDGKTLPLPSVTEHRAGNTSALQNRAKVQRDSINYFPPEAYRACRIGFFTDLQDRAAAWDQFDVSFDRACVGRLYFHVPGGITYGQHWLNVKFPKSLVRAPFRILTAEEEKTFSKHYKSISQQVKDAFKTKKN